MTLLAIHLVLRVYIHFIVEIKNKLLVIIKLHLMKQVQQSNIKFYIIEIHYQ